MIIAFIIGIIAFFVTKSLIWSVLLFYFLTGIYKSRNWLGIPDDRRRKFLPPSLRRVSLTSFLYGLFLWPLILIANGRDPIIDYFQYLENMNTNEVVSPQKDVVIQEVLVPVRKDEEKSNVITDQKMIKYENIKKQLGSITLTGLLDYFTEIIIPTNSKFDYVTIRNQTGGWDYTCKYIFLNDTHKPSYFSQEECYEHIEDRSFYSYVNTESTMNALYDFFLLQVLLDAFSMAYKYPPYHHYAIINNMEEVRNYKEKLILLDHDKYSLMQNKEYPIVTMDMKYLIFQAFIKRFDGVFYETIRIRERKYYEVLESVQIEKNPIEILF